MAAPIPEDRVIELAIGRIFRLSSRPERPGDVEQYERCRDIVLRLAQPRPGDYRLNYARDRNRGAQGD